MAAVLFMVGRGEEDPSVVASLLDTTAHPRKPQVRVCPGSTVAPVRVRRNGRSIVAPLWGLCRPVLCVASAVPSGKPLANME